MKDYRFISAKEFYEKGYLQEVNRRFLHSVGLSLTVEENKDGEWQYLGILDYRDEERPLSMLFHEMNEDEIQEALAFESSVNQEIVKRADSRIDILGGIIEPIVALPQEVKESINESNND